MNPIVLVHGYSAESKRTTLEAISSIYGTLPRALRDLYGGDTVVEIDLSRYVSLEDGVTLDDISRALDRALGKDFSHLLRQGFHVIAHSTGALVVRNWIRRFSPKPSPIRNLIYLAPAHFGSGWAHIARGQLAKWARRVFQDGGERGLLVLDSLEFGSDWTLDLHRAFLRSGETMDGDFKVQEHVIVGTQADVEWYALPIRYAKEDGSDGVIRVSAANLNFNYVRFGPTREALALGWPAAARELDRHLRREGTRRPFYETKEESRPGLSGRPEIPLGIPYRCAHTGEKMGIVVGSGPRKQVLRLLKLALEAKPGEGPVRVEAFRAETEASYQRALSDQAPSWWEKWITEPRAQYDRHAQVILRVRDQDGRPVEHFDIFFDSVRSRRDPSLPMRALFEDKHVNSRSPHIITFYLRTDAFSEKKGKWLPRVPEVDGCFLEISAVEPQTGEILYLPLRLEIPADRLSNWIQGHRTTLLDVELLRLPSPEVFRLVRGEEG